MKVHFLLFFFLTSISTYANENPAFLDSKYPQLNHPRIDKNLFKGLAKNNVLEVISRQSPVKSQGARGTCSIFSATAYLESYLISNFSANNNTNLSEEWLELIALKGQSSDGSTAPQNFTALLNYGMTTEDLMPYIGEDWTERENPLKETRCGHLKSIAKNSCYITHRDPKLLSMTDDKIITTLKDEEFISARKDATEFKNKYLKKSSRSFFVSSTSEIKEILSKGNPLVLEVDFFYGAWNHSEATEFGIDRDTALWQKGIVTAPEIGSVDFEESKKHPAGHSILVVGYDDNKIVERTIKMKDGTMKKFVYKGVYYFKNSWGTNSFGSTLEIDGVKAPGYGMMVYKYAHEQGEFFTLY